MNVDWEFELEYAVGTANNRSHTEVIQLRSGDYTLSFLTFLDRKGHPSRLPLPDVWHETGHCTMMVEGKPIDLTNLGNGRVEVHFPLGMHDHARRD